jgi:transposase
MATTSKTHKSRKTSAPAQKRSKAAGGSPSSTAHAPVVPDPTSDSAKPPKGELEQAGPPGLEPPQELEPKRQSWYRPADSKARKLVEKIVVMRTAGRSDEEIAKRLKTTPPTIRQYIYIGKRNGWLDDEGEPIDLEAELAINIDRKIVRNISASLDGQMTNWQTHEMTIAAAKGRGHFKSDKADSNVIPGGMNVVQIQIINPTVGSGDQVVVEDNVGGVPAYLEGEVDGVLPDSLSDDQPVSLVPRGSAV